MRRTTDPNGSESAARPFPIASDSNFAELYRQALVAYVDQDGGEGSLAAALALGRTALTNGPGLLDLLSMHHSLIASLILPSSNREDFEARFARMDDFLAQVVAPFEMTNRGLHEILGRLRKTNEDLELRVTERTLALTIANTQLQTEIEERKRIAETLRQSRELLGAIVESSAAAIVSETFDGMVTSWNHAAEEMFGYTADEMVGHPVAVIYLPGGSPTDNIGEIDEVIARVRKGERIPRLETQRQHKDGQIIHVAMSISPIRNDAGQIVGMSKIGYDITDRKRAEADLQTREAYLRSVLETVPDAIIVIDEHGKMETFSPAAGRLFGYTAAEAVGKNVSILMPTPYTEAHDSYLSRYLKTGERRIIGIGRIVVGKRKDDTTFPMELAVGEILLNGVRHFTGFVRDLTERQYTEKRLQDLQAELMHVSRLSAMGQMGAALAHELNQPLTAIVNYVQACRRLIDTGGNAALQKVDGVMEKAAEQATRAGQIIRRLRQFVEKGTTDHRLDDINKVVEEASALALVGARDIGVQVSLELASGLVPVVIDRVQVQQVILNLVRNAIEAMTESDKRALTIATRNSEDGMVEVAVRDSGMGIAPDVMRRLFQPFVTTKGSGMGIGLSICRSIIEAHGGKIWAEPNQPQGTVFAFTLPTAPHEDTTGGASHDD